jgi:tetratricopeptide (TPR) repeat protein
MGADVIRAHVRNGELQLARAGATGAIGSADESELGELYALLARILTRTGEPREALRAAEEARTRTDGWEARLAMGEALLAVGEPFRARDELQAALDALRAGGHGEFAGTAQAEVWLGVALAEACRSAGDGESGLAAAMRAAAFAEQAFGKESFEHAEALHALGLCQHAANNEMAAKRILEEALTVRKALAPDHPDVAATLDALGLVARARNQPFDAVKRHREALEIWTKALGERSGPVGACRHALAQALHRTGDFEGARREMAEALLVTGRCFGTDHVDTHIARFELGRFEVDCGQVEEGFRRMEDARKAVRERLGREHPTVKAMDRWL